MRKNAEFGDGVHRGFHDEAAVDVVKVIRAVNQKIVGLRPLAIDSVCLAIAKGAARLGKTGSQRNNAWLKCAELREVAAIQRKAKNLTLTDGLAKICRRTLDEKSVGQYFNLLRYDPDGQM